jgi:hypothetical protein
MQPMNWTEHSEGSSWRKPTLLYNDESKWAMQSLIWTDNNQ